MFIFSGKVIRKSMMVMVAFSLLLGGVFAKEGPTVKQKVLAIAANNKTIPVVFVKEGISAEQIGNATIPSKTLFSKQEFPAEFDAVLTTVIDALKAGTGADNFSIVPIGQIPVKESKVFGKSPDWTATDYNMYILVTLSADYELHTSDKGVKTITLNLKAVIKIMENVLDKKGNKDSKTIKTLYGQAKKANISVNDFMIMDRYERFNDVFSPGRLLDLLKTDTFTKVKEYMM
jgi:hypothetical protein